jgi:hypothetical protein
MGGEIGDKKDKNVWMKAREKDKKVRILRFKTYEKFFDSMERNSIGE